MDKNKRVVCPRCDYDCSNLDSIFQTGEREVWFCGMCRFCFCPTDPPRVRAAEVITVANAEEAKWIMERIAERIRGKDVVELCAGNGALAVEMARVARRVVAIEKNPDFAAEARKRAAGVSNLEIIENSVERAATDFFTRDDVGSLEFDVAVISTGSAEDALRAWGHHLAHEVIMPWQDFRDGKAVVSTSLVFGNDWVTDCIVMRMLDFADEADRAWAAHASYDHLATAEALEIAREIDERNLDHACAHAVAAFICWASAGASALSRSREE